MFAIVEPSTEETQADKDASNTEVAEEVDGTEKELSEEEKAEEEQLAKEKAEQEPPYEVIDGIALFTDDSTSMWSVGSYVDGFSYDMAQLLIEHHADITSGAIFRSVQPLVDAYGNEDNFNVIVVYYSQETIEKINYDNWPTLDASGLYSTADAVYAHPAFRERGAAENIRGSSEAPDLYNSLLGSVVEE